MTLHKIINVSIGVIWEEQGKPHLLSQNILQTEV